MISQQCLLALLLVGTSKAYVLNRQPRSPDASESNNLVANLNADPWTWLHSPSSRGKGDSAPSANPSTTLGNQSALVGEAPAPAATVTEPPRRTRHPIEHVKLLNSAGLWWMMAVVIFVIGATVVKMESSRQRQDAAGQPGARQGGGGKAEEEGGADPARRPSGASEGGAAPGAGLNDEEVQAAARHKLTWFANLVFCIVALNGSMLFWGIAQEFMMTTTYEGKDGSADALPSALVLVLLNRALAVICSAAIIAFRRPQSRFLFEGRTACAWPAISNLAASWCQYQSLAYVSFPLQTAAKSAKLLPVVIMGALRGRRYTVLDYAEAVLIVFALVVFGFETHQGGPARATAFGVLLLCGLVLFDSATPHLQDSVFRRHPELSMVEATFGMSSVACVICLVALLVTGKLLACVVFFVHHPDAILHAVVLSLCSTLTQFLISYTIKHFGPVVFALIATTRQVISVCISAVLFKHHISVVAWLAAAVVFGTVCGRALRPTSTASGAAAEGGSPASSQALAEGLRHGQPASTGEPREQRPLSGADQLRPRSSSWLLRGRSGSVLLIELLAQGPRYWRFIICVLGIHVPLMFYSLAQEFMATHTWHGERFKYPLFLIAANRTGAAILAFVALKLQGLPIFIPQMGLTMLPAGANLAATFCQYEALLFLRYPAQTLAKSVKVIPVMLCGRLLKNRTYTWLDYAEGVLITGLVSFFMWSFHKEKEQLREGALLPGLLLMLGYVLADSFTSNAEDAIYQRVHLDPGQMLLGMQAAAGVVGWITLAVAGQFVASFGFLCRHPHVLLHIAVLVLAEACGAYACTVTVRLFGPAVFTLLLMSHQMVSLLVSVALFKHEVDWLSCLCLSVVMLVILTSSLRRVTSMHKVDKMTTWEATAVPRALAVDKTA